MIISSKSVLCGLAVLFLVTSFSAGDDAGKNDFKPDNAAYWYVKAYEIYKQTDEVKLKDFVRGKAKLTDEIRDFVKKQQPVIEMVTKAAKMEKCDWKYDPVANIWNTYWGYGSLTKNLASLLFVDAKIKKEAANKYSEALDNCETLFRFSHHIEARENMSFLIAIVARNYCFKFLCDFLNNNTDTDFQYLDRINKIINSKYAYFRYTQSDILRYQLKCAETALHKSHNMGLVDLLQQEDGTKNLINFAHQYGLDKINNDCLELYRKYTTEFLALIKTSDLANQDMVDAYEPYKKKIDQAIDFLSAQDDGDRPTQKMYDDFMNHVPYMFLFIYGDISPPMDHYFQIKQQTEFNALRTAVPILIEYRKTGKLANKLPTDKHPGMFSKKPFKYIKAADKFTLECTGYDTRKKKFHTFEFKLPGKKPQ